MCWADFGALHLLSKVYDLGSDLDFEHVTFLLQAVERAAGMDGQKITYTLIKHRLGDLFYRLV